jgi:hypothetical protein
MLCRRSPWAKGSAAYRPARPVIVGDINTAQTTKNQRPALEGAAKCSEGVLPCSTPAAEGSSERFGRHGLGSRGATADRASDGEVRGAPENDSTYRGHTTTIASILARR